MTAVKTIKEAVRASINPRLWFYYLIISVLGYLAIQIVFSLTVGVAIGALVGLVTFQSLQGFQQIMSSPWQLIALLGVASLVYILFAALIGTVLQGLEFNGAKLFLSGTIGITGLLKDSWQKTRPRIVTAFLLSLLVGMISLTVVGLLFVPAIVSGISASSGEFSSIGKTVFWLAAAIIVFLLLAILTAPVLALLSPIVFFERLGAIQTIKLAFLFGTKKYLRNLAFMLVFWLVVVMAVIVFLILLAFAILSFLIPVIGLVIGIVLAIIAVLYLIAVFFWLLAFQVIAMVKYYEMVRG